LNKKIKDISAEIENFRYNMAVIKLRELFEYISNEKITSPEFLETYLKILSPFCPHITEELWEKMGKKSFISLEKWPEVDEKKINEEFEKEDNAIEEIITDVNNILKIVKEKGQNPVRLYLYTLPKEVKMYEDNVKTIEKRTGLSVKVFSVSDAKRHDPQNKSNKAKPVKPGIYLE
jgi:leucyl-tRNA synthetase